MSSARQSSDDELIERTLEGDEEAFAQLVERHQRAIFRTALAIVRDEVEADALTHDTFVQAYLKLSRFERRSGLETWLTRIVINRARDVLRRRRWTSLSAVEGEENDATPELVDAAPDAERRANSRELREAIDRAVSTLSLQQKVIFRLRHYEGRPLEEIARVLNLRAGTVRAHLFRAVHKVRQHLAPWAPLQPAKEGSDETF